MRLFFIITFLVNYAFSSLQASQVDIPAIEEKAERYINITIVNEGLEIPRKLHQEMVSVIVLRVLYGQKQFQLMRHVYAELDIGNEAEHHTALWYEMTLLMLESALMTTIDDMETIQDYRKKLNTLSERKEFKNKAVVKLFYNKNLKGTFNEFCVRATTCIMSLTHLLKLQGLPFSIEDNCVNMDYRRVYASKVENLFKMRYLAAYCWLVIFNSDKKFDREVIGFFLVALESEALVAHGDSYTEIRVAALTFYMLCCPSRLLDRVTENAYNKFLNIIVNPDLPIGEKFFAIHLIFVLSHKFAKIKPLPQQYAQVLKVAVEQIRQSSPEDDNIHHESWKRIMMNRLRLLCGPLKIKI